MSISAATRATPFHALPLEERIKVSYDVLERMRRPNGGYVASVHGAEDGVGDAYNVYWIRDIMFATYDVHGRPGHNTPLAWAQSFHIVAAQTLLNLAYAHPAQFRIPEALRHPRPC